jgi:signal transduction histidine kinase
LAEPLQAAFHEPHLSTEAVRRAVPLCDILQILRIVQEAFANVLKHAGANEVVFSASLAPDQQQAYLSVRDNGRGIAQRSTNHRRGHGVANMEQRAATIGGALDVGSDIGGCVVTLTLPLSLGASAADPT